MGEVQLVLDCGERGKGMAVLRFCPWCGGELAESKRGSHFTTPRDSDIECVQEKMHSVQSVAQMLEVLGPPTDQFENESRSQYTYMHLFDSLVLVVFENKNRIDFSFHGKETNKSNDDSSPA